MSEGDAPRKEGFFRNIWERWIKNNLTLKVISVVFAILLWCTVIVSNVSNDTERIKKIDFVQWMPAGQATLQSEQKLIAKNLAQIRETLPTVSVRVRAKQGDLLYVTAEKLDVTLDLSSVKTKGVQKVWLKARYTGSGRVEEIIPPSISVDIDTFESKMIPIQIDKINELPDGLWIRNDGAAVVKALNGGTTQYLRVSGPSSELENVAMVVATYDLSTLRPGTNNNNIINEKSLPFRYVDSHGQVVDGANLTSDMGSSINVTYNVLSKVTVPIDITSTVSGDPDPDYRVASVVLSQDTVDIAGSGDLLKAIEDVKIMPIPVDGRTESFQETCKILPPISDCTIIPEQVTVTVNIEKRTVQRIFPGISVEATNVNSGDSASISPVTVVVEGLASDVEALKEEDIQATLDCARFAPGTYQTGEVKIELPPDIDAKAHLSPEKTEVRID